MREDILLKLKPLIAAHLERGGFVLVDIRCYKNQARELVFEVLADRAEGGITLDECARLNQELGGMIEESALLQESYMLEVSSPGLDRPLGTHADFRRALGQEARFFLKEPIEGRTEYRGKIVSVEPDRIRIETQTQTQALDIPLEKVNKAKRVIK